MIIAVAAVLVASELSAADALDASRNSSGLKRSFRKDGSDELRQLARVVVMFPSQLNVHLLQHYLTRHRNCLLLSTSVARRGRSGSRINSFATADQFLPHSNARFLPRIRYPQKSKKGMKMASPPKWIANLANSVAECLEPLEPMPPLGCHYHKCDAGWEISIFPSQTEIVGGPEDGRQIAPRFEVDILAVATLFSHIDEMSWQSRTVNENDQLGNHLAVSGRIEDVAVSVRILKTAPACFTPGRKALFNNGCLIETW